MRKTIGNRANRVKNVAKGMLFAGFVAVMLLSTAGCDSEVFTIIGRSMPWNKDKPLPFSDFLTDDGMLDAENIYLDIPDFVFPENIREGQTDGHFPEPVQRSREEIEQTGVTAEDVLAGLDAFVRERDRRANSYDATANFSARFYAILPNRTAGQREDGDIVCPFYYVNDSAEFAPDIHHWFWKEDDPDYTDDFDELIPNVCQIQILYFSAFDWLTLTITDPNLFQNVGVTASDFQTMLEVFHVPTYMMTEEKISEILNTTRMDTNTLRLRYAGETVYDGFVITREVIENATQEQLDALYPLIQSMNTINFEGKDPAKQSEFEG